MQKKLLRFVKGMSTGVGIVGIVLIAHWAYSGDEQLRAQIFSGAIAGGAAVLASWLTGRGYASVEQQKRKRELEGLYVSIVQELLSIEARIVSPLPSSGRGSFDAHFSSLARSLHVYRRAADQIGLLGSEAAGLVLDCYLPLLRYETSDRASDSMRPGPFFIWLEKLHALVLKPDLLPRYQRERQAYIANIVRKRLDALAKMHGVYLQVSEEPEFREWLAKLPEKFPGEVLGRWELSLKEVARKNGDGYYTLKLVEEPK